MSAIIGTGKQTRWIINAEPRSRADELKGLWIDGKPVKENPFQLSDGDGTVTAQSAAGGFQTQFNIDAYHVNLLTDRVGIEKVFDILELDKSKIQILSSDKYATYRKVFMVVLRSPGRLEVCDTGGLCDGELGLYFHNDKLFMLPGYNGKELVVRVHSENDPGLYTLHLGTIDEVAQWSSVSGDLKDATQIDEYKVLKGRVVPFFKSQCLKNEWSRLVPSFKNQGACVSFLERNFMAYK